MKTKYLYGLILLPLFFFASCEKEDGSFAEDPRNEQKNPDLEQPADIPEGYFVVTFFPDTKKSSEISTRDAIVGQDTRVQHVRYVVYKSTGEYVKERVILNMPGGTTMWPLTMITDTLPKGQYQAVFVGNAEKTLFPANPPTLDILTNYKTTFAQGRISMPNAEFKSNTEYYFAKVNFSNDNAQPTVILKRIIGMLKVHRNFIDATQALDQLVLNIKTNINYRTIIESQVRATLPQLVRNVVEGNVLLTTVVTVLGGVTKTVDALVGGLVAPVTDALYDLLLKQLVHSAATALTGNADQAGALAAVGVLLNPWAQPTAATAIVTMNNFPKSVDYHLSVTDTYTGVHNFRFDFPNTSIYAEKNISIKGFSGLFDIRRINVIKTGLVSGFLFDGVIDNQFLLDGSFIDINDPLLYTNLTNRRFMDNYSFLDLKLKSYDQQTDGNHKLSLSIMIKDIPLIDNTLKLVPVLGALSDVLFNTLLAPIKNITVPVDVNLPILGVSNVTLSGKWDTPTEVLPQ